jgi:multiple sugar transport system substrate-binding protein
MTRLKGMTWDHPRGFDPLAKGAAGFAARHPGLEVEWTRRSLRDFGVQPVEVLAQNFDLIVIDHPFCGRAQATGCLVDLRPHLDPALLAALDSDSVGPSTRSYHYGGGIWALPTDAAAQVAAYRPDLLAALGFAPPRTFTEVLRLAQAAREAGQWIALPACQSDAACLLATLSANLGEPISAEADVLLPRATFETVLDHLEQLIGLAHPSSTHWNPINTYDAMSGSDDIVYVPFGFGYSNYSRVGAAKPIRFTTIAGPGPDPAAGTILGGAGCAVSATCRDLPAALTYLADLHRPSHQAGDYFAFGGQPGLRSAWTNPEVDRAAGGFFSATLETLEKAYVRPRFDGFIPAFEEAGLLTHRYLARELDRGSVISGANEAYGRARAARGRSAHP